MSCLSVWIKVYVSVSLVFFDNIAQVLSSDFNGLNPSAPKQLPVQPSDVTGCERGAAFTMPSSSVCCLSAPRWLLVQAGNVTARD